MATDRLDQLDDFVLLKSHKHNGLLRPAGSTLTLTNRLGEWLVSQGIAKRRGLYVPGSLATAAPAASPPALLAKPAAKRTRTLRRCCGWG